MSDLDVLGIKSSKNGPLTVGQSLYFLALNAEMHLDELEFRNEDLTRVAIVKSCLGAIRLIVKFGNEEQRKADEKGA